MSKDSSSTTRQPVTLAEKWLNAFETFLLGLFLYLAPPTFATLILLSVLQLGGMSTNEIAEWFKGATLAQFLYVAITEAIVIGILYFLLKHARLKLADIGVQRPKIRHIQYVFLGFIVYFSLYACIAGSIMVCQNAADQGSFVASACNTVDFEQEQQIGFNKDISGVSLVLVFLSLVVLPPVVEEILFRGYLYNRLRRAFSVVWAGFLVSVLFGVAHLQLDTGNIPLWSAAIDTFLLSVVLVYIREKTGTIWAGVCIHALKNFIAFAVLFSIFR